MIKNDGNWERVPAELINKSKSKSFSDYMDMSIIFIVAVLFIAIICTFFVEFIFDAGFNWAEISANTVSVSACTIAIYLLLRSYSMRKGRRTDEWKEARARLAEQSKEVLRDNRIKLVSQYCREWEQTRLETELENVLAPVGITLAEYREKYAKYDGKELKAQCKELTAYQLKTVLRAKRIKKLKFDERYFYTEYRGNGRRRSPSEEITTKSLNRLIIARIVLTTVLTLSVSTTLLWEMLISFSWEAVIRCVVKLAIIIFFGATGMVGGYNFTTTREVSEMNAKADEIEIFLKWCGER